VHRRLPVCALKETDAIQKVWNALNDKSKRVVVQTAPAVRVAIGEEFGFEPGARVTGKLAASLHALGFDDVFDTISRRTSPSWRRAPSS
jgi:iron only hydrogenase large subunit-like protein